MSRDTDIEELLRAVNNLAQSPVTALKDRSRAVPDARPQFETDTDRMERRLREDERRVQRQRRLVLDLRAHGLDSRMAEDLLHILEDLLAERRVLWKHLKR